MLSITKCYIDFVNKILKQGKETYKDSNHHLVESLGNFYIIDDPLDLKFKAKYENYTTAMMLNDIKSGKFDIDGCPIKSDALYEYVKSFENSSDQGFVYTYPNRVLAHFNIDQFDVMKERILNATGSNRAVAITYDPKLDADREDIPCLQFLQCLVRNNELTIHCLFRSNDIFGAFYSNMFFIAYIGLKMKEEVNKELLGKKLNFGGIHYHSTSGHIYNTDLKAARTLISNNK
ncbi:thymidylate synthase [Methanobrevibacter oralis]|uniref:Thymidylate synthase n=1 Tax=Methanobrevibacter oralis TaxID=66851 RepID=A0A166B1R0_METOA|nr:thymidylate synthase [Methanobrevibacter oralis]KZX12753.1 thymidylate synthase [Methanobrevibacter oralis]